MVSHSLASRLPRCMIVSPRGSLVRHPVDLAKSDRAAAGGQHIPSTEPPKGVRRSRPFPLMTTLPGLPSGRGAIAWFVSSGANARWAQVGGALRKYSAHVGAEAPSRRPGVAPITPSAGGNVSTFPPRASMSLPPAEGVIALWEVDETARTRCPSPESCWPAARRPISETCPPGEGIKFVDRRPLYPSGRNGWNAGDKPSKCPGQSATGFSPSNSTTRPVFQKWRITEDRCST